MMTPGPLDNHGPPISEDLRARLFDPFRHGSRDRRTAPTAGLGLGLFSYSEIVAPRMSAPSRLNRARLTEPRFACRCPAPQ